MPEMTRYEHGVPSWVDIGTPDLGAGVRFYSELFGWEGQDMGEEAGHYTIATQGRQAGRGDLARSGPGSAAVDDLHQRGRRGRGRQEGGSGWRHGHRRAHGRDGRGRMAIFADTTGAVIAAWQPGQHLGAQLVNEPGALTWSELSSSDPAKSKAFYSAVFGWGWGGGDDYPEAQVSGRTIGGLMPRRPDMPADVPDNWLVYFGAADVDADVKKATDLGASVVAGPADIPGTGRFAVLIDPQGAAFALFQS